MISMIRLDSANLAELVVIISDFDVLVCAENNWSDSCNLSEAVFLAFAALN